MKNLKELEFEKNQIDFKIEEKQEELKKFNLAIFNLQPEITKVINELDELKTKKREINEQINSLKED